MIWQSGNWTNGAPMSSYPEIRRWKPKRRLSLGEASCRSVGLLASRSAEYCRSIHHFQCQPDARPSCLCLFEQNRNQTPYSIANHIVAITNDFIPYLNQWNIDPAKVSVIPNWGPIEQIPVLPRNNQFSDSHGFSEKFVILYCGTLGKKQGIQAHRRHRCRSG